MCMHVCQQFRSLHDRHKFSFPHRVGHCGAMSDEALDWLLDSEQAAPPPGPDGGARQPKRTRTRTQAPTEVQMEKPGTGSKKPGKATALQRRLARPLGKSCTVRFVFCFCFVFP